MPTTNRIIMNREDLRLLIECAQRQEKVLRKKAEHQKEMFDPFRPSGSPAGYSSVIRRGTNPSRNVKFHASRV